MRKEIIYPGLTDDVFWFVHISDTHIGFDTTSRINFRWIELNVPSIINPSFIINTGDLTDGSNCERQLEQFPYICQKWGDVNLPDGPHIDEWLDYNAIAMNIPNYYDIPGNHDRYNDPNWDGGGEGHGYKFGGIRGSGSSEPIKSGSVEGHFSWTVNSPGSQKNNLFLATNTNDEFGLSFEAYQLIYQTIHPFTNIGVADYPFLSDTELGDISQSLSNFPDFNSGLKFLFGHAPIKTNLEHKKNPGLIDPDGLVVNVLSDSASSGTLTIKLYDASDFPDKGTGWIIYGGLALKDEFSWEGKNGNELTGCDGVEDHPKDVIVVGSHDDRGGGDLIDTMDQYEVSAYLYGHINLNSVYLVEHPDPAKAGKKVLAMNTAELKSNYYRIVAIDNGGVSTTTATVGNWPVILITSPVSKNLSGGELNPFYYPVPRSNDNVIRALVFVNSGNMEFEVSRNGYSTGWLPMQSRENNIYEGVWDNRTLPEGEYQIEVREQNNILNNHRILVDLKHPNANLNLSNTTPFAGSNISASGSNFAPDTIVRLTLDGKFLLATLTTDASGAFINQTIQIPIVSEADEHYIRAFDEKSNYVDQLVDIQPPLQAMGTLSITTTNGRGNIFINDDPNPVGNGSWSGSVPVGVYWISFENLSSSCTPLQAYDQKVAVHENQTTYVEGEYFCMTYNGLWLHLLPDEAILAGAQWRMDNGPWRHSGYMEGNVSVGSHTLEFKEINGWINSPPYTVDLDMCSTAGTCYGWQLMYFNYKHLSLQVTITPQEAIADGAMWRVADIDTYWRTGDSAIDLPIGNHTIEFKDITGWRKPDNQIVEISRDKTTQITGIYAKKYYPLNINKSGNGTVIDNYGSINCGSNCSNNVVHGTSVTLTATPDSGNNFSGWTGCDCFTGNTCYVTMDSSKSVMATFTESSNTSTYEWEIETLDNCGNVGFISSIAIDSLNNVHISYSKNNGELNYMTNATGSWVVQRVDISGSDIYTFDSSIALDSLDKAHISYYDTVNSDIKYATNATGSWVTQTVDSYRDLGARNSIALDSLNKVHIIYTYTNGPADMLKYASNASGSWIIQTIDGVEETNHNYYSWGVGTANSIAIDSSDNVHVIYSRGNCLFCPTHLRGYQNSYIYANNSAGSWSKFQIDNADPHNAFTSIAVDSLDRIHISYRNRGNSNNISYTTNATGLWINQVVDQESGSNTLPNAISLDSSDKVHLSYATYLNNGASMNYANNVTGTWITQKIDNVLYEQSNSESYSINGSDHWIEIDSKYNVHIIYSEVHYSVDEVNTTIKYATRNVSDIDNDGILNDGDSSGIIGDNPCTGGSITNCDDNCINTPNADQADAEGDGIGDACDSGNYHTYDNNPEDWIIGDFELLDAIDIWANGNLGDFELLDLIDYWAIGCYQWDALSGSYKSGC